MGQTTSSPPPSSNEERFLAEYNRLVRSGNSGPSSSSGSELERLLGERDILQAERSSLEGRMSSLVYRLESLGRANKARILEGKLNALYARVHIGPHALPDAPTGDVRRSVVLGEDPDVKRQVERAVRRNSSR